MTPTQNRALENAAHAASTLGSDPSFEVRAHQGKAARRSLNREPCLVVEAPSRDYAIFARGQSFSMDPRCAGPWMAWMAMDCVG